MLVSLSAMPLFWWSQKHNCEMKINGLAFRGPKKRRVEELLTESPESRVAPHSSAPFHLKAEWHHTRPQSCSLSPLSEKVEIERSQVKKSRSAKEADAKWTKTIFPRLAEVLFPLTQSGANAWEVKLHKILERDANPERATKVAFSALRVKSWPEIVTVSQEFTKNILLALSLLKWKSQNQDLKYLFNHWKFKEKKSLTVNYSSTILNFFQWYFSFFSDRQTGVFKKLSPKRCCNSFLNFVSI